ncbi:cell division protein FtsH [Candidatus Roizmanbacteria bacterium CG22_combo_CG10-13_8_21_14_all_38_20]|uniref:ATP-dependent zinc metalloprotease FtsH n=1 Tax=Candidatus Roizmanbacteria bacterium CG22_combo_CG10-13_8_21_14_all_38_20 TaxID=1974862 RepID=A0A2H0BW26_9BACT|nr:ATP-dependent zinc metalloprotease FtsH [Candidatus Microgenomates bacterium]PIP61250.1 MAG: cell division protein FtsH [Candidatus Roizmanbacteria bacterium CG22_combo_CG10-13_8_21_14_all_38_20]PJC31241.1 MAG: cell division protein FtsH [Candidatus Roizmanbacteria bacterium CG_4_9_14_0_2_um_filter_38_17]
MGIKKIRKEFKLNLNIKNLFLWGLILFFALSFLASLNQASQELEKKPLSSVLTDIKAGKIKKVMVEERKVTAEYNGGDKFESFKEPQASFVEILQNAQIDPKRLEIEIEGDSFFNVPFIDLVINILPILLMVGFFFFIFRQAKGAQSSIFSFGQSTAKLFDQEKPKITFKDIAGIQEAKKEMEEIVDFLKHPKKYASVGARTPKGVLLVGPSGTGKTLLAKAVAGEAKVPFFSMAGSEFMEMLVGVGSARMRDLFKTAKKQAPSIIFIDEVDAIGRTRSVGAMGGHDEREQTLNQMLVEMDGFEPNESVIVIAATNRGDMLDSALLRPGRFDRRIQLDLPDIEGRQEIAMIHAKGKPFVKSINWKKVARRTVGFSGADIENMMNEAAILTARENKLKINMEHIEEAATKVKLGPEKKRLQSDEDRKMTAYHEAGHAVMSYVQEDTDPVHRISIVSRGRALGFNLIVPETDRTHETKTRLLAQIRTLLGGRAAEELIFSEMTSGASSDIDVSTRIARAMVLDFGMSKLGPIDFGSQMQEVEIGKGYFEQPQISPQMQSLIDQEVKLIIDNAYTDAKQLLKKHKLKLDRLAKELLIKETLDGEELDSLMKKD